MGFLIPQGGLAQSERSPAIHACRLRIAECNPATRLSRIWAFIKKSQNCVLRQRNVL